MVSFIDMRPLVNLDTGKAEPFSGCLLQPSAAEHLAMAQRAAPLIQQVAKVSPLPAANPPDGDSNPLPTASPAPFRVVLRPTVVPVPTSGVTDTSTPPGGAADDDGVLSASDASSGSASSDGSAAEATPSKTALHGAWDRERGSGGGAPSKPSSTVVAASVITAIAVVGAAVLGGTWLHRKRRQQRQLAVAGGPKPSTVAWSGEGVGPGGPVVPGVMTAPAPADQGLPPPGKPAVRDAALPQADRGVKSSARRERGGSHRSKSHSRRRHRDKGSGGGSGEHRRSRRHSRQSTPV